jgi:hypothetical protein
MTTAAVPFRDTFWNIPAWAQVLLYVGGLVAMVLFAWGLWQRIALWRQGGPEARLDQIPRRLKLVAVQALGQAARCRRPIPA